MTMCTKFNGNPSIDSKTFQSKPKMSNSSNYTFYVISDDFDLLVVLEI